MARVKDFLMDLQDLFYDHVEESLLTECENFQEFSTRAYEAVEDVMTKRDSDDIAKSVWNEFWSYY